ncbi:MAG: class I SAM-dependent RNA methyltransferase [Candidatus Wallbacteria bacterium]|nr:class I SAM-dependent RNA methyltransferase [Candidatus Wallbacteria bacterium]
MSLRSGDRVEVIIDSLAYGGKGVARYRSQVVFVALATPGDRVRVRVVEARQRFAEAVIEELLEAGETRRDPGCPVFGRCGGCQWLHVSEAAQARAKEEALFGTLARVGKVSPSARDPIVAAGPGEELGYRSRALMRGRSAGGVATLGFFAEGGRSLVGLPASCLVLDPRLDRAVAELSQRRWPAGAFELELTAVDDGRVHATLHVEAAAGYARALDGFPHRILDGRGRLLAETEPELRVATKLWAAGRDVTVLTRPGVFSQVHRAQNQRLVDCVLEYAALSGSERVLDLYSGSGNLALPLATRARAVTGVEWSAESVADARLGAEASGLSNCEFHAADVTRWLESPDLAGHDVVVLDPPRSGAALAMAPLAGARPRRIVYASCNPATLARDAGRLTELGYRLARARAIDMFPQTFHVEAVALFEPADAGQIPRAAS